MIREKMIIVIVVRYPESLSVYLRRLAIKGVAAICPAATLSRRSCSLINFSSIAWDSFISLAVYHYRHYFVQCRRIYELKPAIKLLSNGFVGVGVGDVAGGEFFGI